MKIEINPLQIQVVIIGFLEDFSLLIQQQKNLSFLNCFLLLVKDKVAVDLEEKAIMNCARQIVM